jgi:hypothetical protein
MAEALCLRAIRLPQLRSQSWEWQRGWFDPLLRSDQNLWSKWIYVSNNPARNRFVHTDNWPCYLDSIKDPADQGSGPLPLQFKGVGAQ